MRRRAFSLIELLVTIAIASVLTALLLAAIQRARSAAAAIQCRGNLHSIGIAIHQYHDTTRRFPAGVTLHDPDDGYNHLSWRPRLFPYLDQQPLWSQTEEEYTKNAFPNLSPYHSSAAVPLPVFSCSLDSRLKQAQTYTPYRVALASYLGVEGTNYTLEDGLLYRNSRIRTADVRDGLSTTLLVGERPPSSDYRYGWLYFGVGQAQSGSLDHNLGVREMAHSALGCSAASYHFVPAELGAPCAFMHFWSMHDGGSHFLMADGSVQFLSYDADLVLPALATRAGSEPAVP